tara:strand:- start:147 stop:518 length:372 start_codon:yes stop_codon:yes gene_type:complete
MPSLNNALFKRLIIKFVDELSQNDFECVRKKVQFGYIDGANYRFRVAAWERFEREEERIMPYDKNGYWRDEFEVLVQKFVDELDDFEFSHFHEVIKKDTWGFLRVGTWISNATNNRTAREEEN